jgi:exonuclease V
LRPDDGIMAASTAQLTNAISEYGSDVEIGSVAALSDYGSDIELDDIDEDSILADVLETIRVARPTEKDRVLPSVEFEAGELEDEDQNVGGGVQIHKPSLLRMAKGRVKSLEQGGSLRDVQSSPLRDVQALEVEYDERSRRAWSGTSARGDIESMLTRCLTDD